MNVAQLADQLRKDSMFMKDVTRWEVIPARRARTAPFPACMDGRLKPALESRGIHELYIHQVRSLEATDRGEDVTVVTPTASGKTMCYNLPVLSAILKDEDARALYIFPTKALSADQVSELYDMIEEIGVDIKTYTYDGDTPAAARKAVRQAGHIVVTNPDMLHSGILPHHTKWVKLFENLKYIVIDEIHTYRGVFGSNLANVLRRLLRLCDFYGSHPQFILCSATIANPKELAETLIGRPVTLVDENGAPMGERHFVFYNPPVVNRQLGIRKGAIPITRTISGMLLKNGIQSITFARSRLTVSEGSGARSAGQRRQGAGVPGRLSAGRASGNRARPSQREGGRRGVHQRAGARHRYRRPGRLRHVRLSRNHCQCLAAGRPGRKTAGNQYCVFHRFLCCD